jgi:flap endonuclease-1
MGIKGLTKLLEGAAPNSFRETTVDELSGRVAAIDASTALYQFMNDIKIQSKLGNIPESALKNDRGEITSHLKGMLARAVRYVQLGVKPVWVFDGKPPELKRGELRRRREIKQLAEKRSKEAEERGDVEEANRQNRRATRVEREHVEGAKKLLRLLGFPVIEAPSEAEAQCVDLCTRGAVDAVVSEDMDCLTFGAPLLLRNVKMSKQRTKKVLRFRVKDVLDGLNMTMEQFVDMCILCGCDYAPSIPGIGPKRALDGIRKHGCVEAYVRALQDSGSLAKLYKNEDKTAAEVISDLRVEAVRKLFFEPEVLHQEELPRLQWEAPQTNALVDWLVRDNGFSKKSVESSLDRLTKARKRGVQGRITSIFAKRPAPTTKSRRLKNGDGPPAKRSRIQHEVAKRDVGDENGGELRLDIKGVTPLRAYPGPPLIHKVISGGQTGADRGGLDAAMKFTWLETGGYCPKGRKAEDGIIPTRYNTLEETDTEGYPRRTALNVKASDATVLFTEGGTLTRGSNLTKRICLNHQKPFLHVNCQLDEKLDPATLAPRITHWVLRHNVTCVNIAGTRETDAPGIQAFVRKVTEMFLVQTRKITVNF